MKLARSAADLALEGFQPRHDPDALGHFEPADPSPLALAHRDEARRIAGDLSCLGALWEQEIAAYKADLRATARATTEARRVVKAWVAAEYPASEALVLAASDALRTARDLAAVVTHPEIEAVRAESEAMALAHVRLTRERDRAVREAAATVRELLAVARGRDVQRGRVALRQAREALRGVQGTGHLAADIDAAERGFWGRLRKAG